VVDEPLGDAGSGDGFAGGDDADRGEEDSVTGADILNLLRELHTDGTTIVVITHSAEVAQAAHRRITLRDGLVAHDTGSIE
jgi:putative ABC transport system ATP-binding protein